MGWVRLASPLSPVAEMETATSDSWLRVMLWEDLGKIGLQCR